jgi:hypothetical protein
MERPMNRSDDEERRRGIAVLVSEPRPLIGTFDWTHLIAYMLLAGAFIWSARENRLQTESIATGRTALEKCVNELRTDMRMVVRDVRKSGRAALVKAEAQLESEPC